MSEMLELYERVNELKKTPDSFAEWIQQRRYIIYKHLPELLKISKQTISHLSANRQKPSIDLVKRMAIISATPATILVDNLDLLDFSLREIKELKKFDNEHQNLFDYENQGNGKDERRAASQ